MKLHEIIRKKGLYVADGFAEGFCFKVDENLTLKGVQYKDKDDLLPTVEYYPLHASLFDK